MRELLRSQLMTHRAVDERERRSVEYLIAALDRLEDPFDQERDLEHVTGSAIIIGPRGVVLLLHRRLGIWVQPGGHLEVGETPWQAAQREAIEETGLEIVLRDGDREPAPLPVHIDVHAGGRGHTHLDIRYLFTAGTADPAPPPDESQEVGWFAWEQAIERADPGLRGALMALYRPTG